MSPVAVSAYPGGKNLGNPVYPGGKLSRWARRFLCTRFLFGPDFPKQMNRWNCWNLLVPTPNSHGDSVRFRVQPPLHGNRTAVARLLLTLPGEEASSPIPKRARNGHLGGATRVLCHPGIRYPETNPKRRVGRADVGAERDAPQRVSDAAARPFEVPSSAPWGTVLVWTERGADKACSLGSHVRGAGGCHGDRAAREGDDGAQARLLPRGHQHLRHQRYEGDGPHEEAASGESSSYLPRIEGVRLDGYHTAVDHDRRVTVGVGGDAAQALEDLERGVQRPLRTLCVQRRKGCAEQPGKCAEGGYPGTHR